LNQLRAASPQPNLPAVLARLASIRHNTSALRYGEYKEIFVAAEQFAFSRNTQHESVFVLLNAAATDSAFDIPVSFPNGTRLVDLLNPADEFHVENGRLRVEKVHSCWARILQVGQ